MIRREIANLVEKSITELQREKVFPIFKIPEITIERPENKNYGDYSTNTALKIAKLVGKNHFEVADMICNKIIDLYPSYLNIKKISIFSQDGFINLFLPEEHLQRQIGEILKKESKFGQLKIGKNKKTNIEFISANPTTSLHIGNGRGAFFGDCLANILQAAGYKVTREYFINDSRNSTQIQELGKTALSQGKSYLTPYLKKLISKLKPHLKKFRSVTDAGYFLSQNVLHDIKKFVKDILKIKFDFWTSEQILYRGDKVKTIYKFLKDKNLVFEKDKAFWLDLSKLNQKDEVLIRENGQPTYFLSDIAYHKDKIDRGYKKIVDIWGADHQGHVPRMKAIMNILEYKGEFDVLITQIVSLKGKKMSKRRGEVITLEWLVNEIGLDAARFFYLMKSLDTQMDFDLKLAKKQSKKNPVYYVQYAHARIDSILKKFKTNVFTRNLANKKKLKLLNHRSEIELIKQLIRLPEIIEDTTRDFQVQRIPQYAIDIATSFHQFYRDCRVISEDKNLTRARLALILATKTVLKNTLDLMGISAPKRM